MESLRPLDVQYEVLFVNGRLSRWNYPRSVRKLRCQLADGQYDLVHAHFGLSGWVARCQLRLPVVLTFHGDDLLGKFRFDGTITPMGRFFQASSLALAHFVDAIIVQSRQMRRMLRHANARVIPCGIDLNMFQPMGRDEARRRLGLDRQKKFVLFAYDPGEQGKRYDLIERAVIIARARVQQLDILRARGMPHAQMPLYMNAADALVVASEAEGGPLVTKEAMAVNLPVITVPVGDAVEILRGSEGNHIVPRDVEAIAAKLVSVCQHGTRSRSRQCLEPYSMPATAAKVLEVYRSVL